MSDNSPWSQEELVEAIAKFQLAPQDTDAPKELSRWLAWLPWLKKAGKGFGIFSLGAGREWANGKASQETAKTDVLMAEAGEIASKTDLNYAEAERKRAETEKTRTETLREENRIIDEALDGDELAVKFKLANVLAHCPEIAEQLEKVQEIGDRLRLKHGTSIELQVEDDSDDEQQVLLEHLEKSNASPSHDVVALNDQRDVMESRHHELSVELSLVAQQLQGFANRRKELEQPTANLSPIESERREDAVREVESLEREASIKCEVLRQERAELAEAMNRLAREIAVVQSETESRSSKEIEATAVKVGLAGGGPTVSPGDADEPGDFADDYH